MDNNPGLPNMSKIINNCKHILDLDDKLKKVIPSKSLFVSNRKSNTIGDFLIHSKLNPREDKRINHQASNVSVVLEQPTTYENSGQPGCFACGKCYLCKYNYLTPCKNFTSYHTDKIFTVEKHLTCQTEGVIYLAECINCERSYVGYTTSKIQHRFSNNKHHIKIKNHSCELTKHYIDSDHQLDMTSYRSYDTSLSKCMKLIIIDCVDFKEGETRDSKIGRCEDREKYWQTQLKTFQRYGGLNKRENNVDDGSQDLFI